MNVKQAIAKLLKDEKNQDEVSVFGAYVLEEQQNPKAHWFKNYTPEQFSEMFLKVKNEGLFFDGKHITLQSTGITYDYVAYKNKMLLAYPETEIDLGVVVHGDSFTIGKENGKIKYKHTVADAFNTPNENNITGAYCVIKNKRGEFETRLSKEELVKHKNSAKTKFIWDKWYKEMVLKTVIKKATKYHFDDMFESMNDEDNKSIDLEPPTASVEDIEKAKIQLQECETLDDLKKVYSTIQKNELLKNHADLVSVKNDMKENLTKKEN